MSRSSPDQLAGVDLLILFLLIRSRGLLCGLCGWGGRGCGACAEDALLDRNWTILDHFTLRNGLFLLFQFFFVLPEQEVVDVVCDDRTVIQEQNPVVFCQLKHHQSRPDLSPVEEDAVLESETLEKGGVNADDLDAEISQDGVGERRQAVRLRVVEGDDVGDTGVDLTQRTDEGDNTKPLGNVSKASKGGDNRVSLVFRRVGMFDDV